MSKNKNEVIFECVLVDHEGGNHAFFGPFVDIEAAKNKFSEGVRNDLFVSGTFSPRFLNAPETTKLSEIVVAAQVPRVV